MHEPQPPVPNIPPSAEADESAWKIPLERRADTPEKKELLADLEKRARDIEQRLFVAYPRATKNEMREASERVLEDLITLAKDAGGLAKSYRNFNVGGVILGIRPMRTTADNPWKIIFNANTKPADAPKWCAELYMMDELATPENEITQVLAFVVVGKPQRDNDSGREQITLTPCKLCRDRMLTMTLGEKPVITPDTEVITANARDTRYRKFQKVRDLHQFHGEQKYIEID